MTKQITDSERLLQMTLNRKYTELEEKDRQIKQLQREKESLLSQVREHKETSNTLCRQVSSLLLTKSETLSTTTEYTVLNKDKEVTIL